VFPINTTNIKGPVVPFSALTHRHTLTAVNRLMVCLTLVILTDVKSLRLQVKIVYLLDKRCGMDVQGFCNALQTFIFKYFNYFTKWFLHYKWNSLSRC